MVSYVSIALMLSFLCVGCSNVAKDVEAIKNLDSISQDVTKQLTDENPGLKKDLEDAAGYIVMDMKLTKVPMIGGGGGQGIIYTKNSDEKVYVRAVRFDAGWGGGIRSYKVLIVVHSSTVLEKAKKSRWIFDTGAEVAAGAAVLDAGTGSVGEDYDVYHLADVGASATFTARAIRVSTTPIQ